MSTRSTRARPFFVHRVFGVLRASAASTRVRGRFLRIVRAYCGIFLIVHQGVGSPLAGQMFFQAMKFCAYGQSLEFVRYVNDIPDTQANLSPFQYFQAGFIAQAFGAFIEGPVDFYKTQIQIQLTRVRENPKYVPEFKTVREAARVITGTNGVIGGSYQAFGVTLLRNVLAGGSYLASFETMRLYRSEALGVKVKDLPLFETFMCGGLSGLFYWVPYFPIDVVKSSMQADHYDKSRRTYKGYADCIRQIYASSGIKGFYKGFAPCIARSFPANAALLVTVFQLKNLGIPW
eukprot:m.94593 g.94593  ORF g.94593 m.94593 type:complete len:290 (-) comp51257_c0_seq1:843-1712(-)